MNKKKHFLPSCRFSLRINPGIENVFFIFILCLFIFSCRKSKPPQIPSNKNLTEEKQSIDLISFNKKLVEKEDSLLTIFIKENDPEFVKVDLGFWYKKNNTGRGEFLQKNDICVIDYQIYLLDDTLIEEIKGKMLTIGKKEVIPGLDAGLELMRKGENATFIFPWNMAFGIQGYKDVIPSYASVKIILNVNNE